MLLFYLLKTLLYSCIQFYYIFRMFVLMYTGEATLYRILFNTSVTYGAIC